MRTHLKQMTTLLMLIVTALNLCILTACSGSSSQFVSDEDESNEAPKTLVFVQSNGTVSPEFQRTITYTYDLKTNRLTRSESRIDGIISESDEILDDTTAEQIELLISDTDFEYWESVTENIESSCAGASTERYTYTDDSEQTYSVVLVLGCDEEPEIESLDELNTLITNLYSE